MHIVTRINAVQRLASDIRLHHQFRLVHRAGPRSVGMLTAELLDHLNVDSVELDFILTWCRFDPAIVAAVGGEFPRPPLVLVPST